jgi:hypothetical protein
LLLTAFTAERAAERDTVPVFTGFLIVRLFDGFCERALPAADFDAALVRPSRSVLDAALPALAEVDFPGALTWDSALPAAVFDAAPVDLLPKVFEAWDAALFPVVFDPAMGTSQE